MVVRPRRRQRLAKEAGEAAGGGDFRTRGPRGFALAIEQTDADRVRPLATKVLALLAIAMARLSKTQLVCAHPQTEKVVRASADKALVEWAAVMKAHKAASAASNSNSNHNAQ